MRPEPTRIEPIFSPRIWGARSLAPLFPEKSNLAEPLGEAWLTGVDCRVANGPFAGKTLGEAWRGMPGEWRGTRLASTANFPLLVKFIFPNDKLSIQVHPDDDYAAAHEQAAGGRGKTEMWHAVSAEPGTRVLVGLKPGVDKEKFLRSLTAHTVENLFQAHEVKAGDTFFVPAGTPHTIGPGMALCEVQEYSDLTYRVYDYGRVDARGKPRELHIEKALEVMNFGTAAGGKVLPAAIPGGAGSLLAACRYFAAERWDVPSPCGWQLDETQFELVVILSGTGALGWKHGQETYHGGECWMLPASLETFAMNPSAPTVMLRTYVPNLAALRDAFRREGIAEHALVRVFFS
jgi:mannose-6-phosphate isomerase